MASVVLVSACGSRSGVDAWENASGGGASTSSTSTSLVAVGGGGQGATGGQGGTGGQGASGGEGGTGGVAVTGECSALKVAGPPAILSGGQNTHQRTPVWTLSSDDGSQVTLVSASQVAEGPAGGDFPVNIVHTSLSPWVNFPSGQVLGVSFTADADGGSSFAASRSPGDRFALLFADPMAPQTSLVFSNEYQPSSASLPTLQNVDFGSNFAAFVTQGKGGHLLGSLLPVVSIGGNGYEFRALMVGNDGTQKPTLSLGCAASAMFADAVELGGGWLMAMSNGSVFGAPDCSGPTFNWPDEVQIAVVKEGAATNTDFLGAPGGATDVKMAKRSDGAWLAIGTPPGQVVSAMVLGARLNVEGKVVSTFQIGGGDVLLENVLDHTLTIASVGDYLAVAWVDFAGDKGPFIRVKTFDPEGNPAAKLEIFVPGLPIGAPALLGSPISNSLVLAWSQPPDPGSGSGDSMRAVRLDCVTR